MNPPRHEMVRASAGSGKTRELSARFVHLLLLGVDPWRIAALTFTRKAAGEFLDRIIALLCDLAENPSRAAEYFPDAAEGEITTDDALNALERVARAAGRLRLGTIDSFFLRMTRAFALELGLPGTIQVLQGTAETAARQRVLRRLMAEKGAVETALIEAFTLWSHGEAHLDIAPKILELITDYHAVFLETRPGFDWGDPAAIWPPDRCPWKFDTTEQEFARLLDGAASLAGRLQHKTARNSFEKQLEELRSWRPGAALTDKQAGFLIKYLLPLIGKLEEGKAVLEYSRKTFIFEGDSAKAAAALLRALVGSALARHLARTRGISCFLQTYEALHDREVRAHGGLTFADLPALLDPGRFTKRELLDYRLDGALDHWLLDEFQDTSRPQWRVLQNLADEVIQSADGHRSFFAVGDVKQAIYGFRGGDAGLFQRILDHYNRGSSCPVISERHLDTTYRLAPPLVDAVNTVFDPGALPPAMPDEARRLWRELWSPHKSGRPGLTGFARVAFFDKKAETDEDDVYDEENGAESGSPDTLTPLQQAVIDRLEILHPWARGLSCALLCRTNDQAQKWTELLRDNGIPCTGEGADSPALDNDIGAAVRALFRLASHPGDTAAFEFLRMTPLAELLSEGRLAASAALRGALRSDGFEPAIRRWLAGLRGQLDPFNAQRLDDLLGAAADFDAAGGSDPDAFLEWLEKLETPARAAPGTVAVMTIHKAKGLEFDAVFVPVTPSRNRGPKGGDLHVIRDDHGNPAGVLELPRKEIVMADETLRKLRLRSQAETAGEMLRLLYVAFTRARRELRVLVEKTSADKAKDAAENPILDAADFLCSRFGAGDLPLDFGEQHWFPEEETVSDRPQTGPASPERTRIDPALLRPRLRRVSPSSAAHPEAALETVNWQESTDAGVTLGLRVHELFSQIEWLDAPSAAPEALPFAQAGHDDLPARLVFACLRNPAIFDRVFRRPETPCRLLREAPFEWIAPKKSGPGEWMTGVFDRVVVHCEPGGQAVSALIVDFKTDTAGPGEIAERYAAQLRGYRDALAAIEGLATDKVELALIHVRSQTFVPLA